jgi:hypothetical protein
MPRARLYVWYFLREARVEMVMRAVQGVRQWNPGSLRTDIVDEPTYSPLLASLVEQAFHVARHGACPLVNKCIPWLMVKKPRNGHALLFATAKDVLPLLPRVPSTLPIRQVAEARVVENTLEVHFRLVLLAHVELAVWIDDLVSERADAEIRPLG